MTTTDSGDRRVSLKAGLLERLHDPLQLRICAIAVVLLTGYGAVYQPLSNKIDETTKKLRRDKGLLDLAGSVEQLQGQYHSFGQRLPQQVDAKEWVQFVLEGIRRLPLKMLKFDCRPPRKLGPYKIVVLQIQLEGSFFDLDKFLRWLESNERLLRADDVRMAPTRGGNGNMGMQVTVLGMAG
jgi:Tfp pilus assembly protein PilO